jgi:hypothetical protein
LLGVGLHLYGGSRQPKQLPGKDCDKHGGNVTPLRRYQESERQLKTQMIGLMGHPTAGFLQNNINTLSALPKNEA